MSSNENLTRSSYGAADDVSLFKALSHPLRYRIMMVLGDREASPKELSEILEAGFKHVCEQVQILKKGGHIELVGEDKRRGGVQHIYKAVHRPVMTAEEWERLPTLARELISEAILRRASADISASLRAGLFDAHVDRVLHRKPMTLDAEGLKEVDRSALRHLEELTRIETTAADRRLKSGEPGMRIVNLTVAVEVPVHY